MQAMQIHEPTWMKALQGGIALAKSLQMSSPETLDILPRRNQVTNCQDVQGNQRSEGY